MKFSHLAALLILTLLGCSPIAAQSTLLQGGPLTAGHAPMYLNSGSSQPVVQDSGPASGGVGLGMSEGLYVARGTGTPPYIGQGTGPLGTNWCDYDAPITNATGYHYFCLSANAQGGGLLAYGAGGVATPLPLNFNINGATYSFPAILSGVAGPNSSTVDDLACWNNTAGTILSDCTRLSVFGTANIAWYGAVGDNSTDNCTPITNAMASGANFIYVPAGSYRISCPITVGAGQTLAGGNENTSILVTTSATADFVTLSGIAASIQNVLLTTSVTRTAGWYVRATASDSIINRIGLSGYFNGISIEGATPASPNVFSRASNVHGFSPATGSGSNAFRIINFSSAFISDILMGGAGAPQQDIGLLITSGDTVVATNIEFVASGLGLKIQPANNHFTGAVNFSQCLFDSPDTTDAAQIVAASNQAITSVKFANCSFGNGAAVGKDGLNITTTGTGTIDDISCANCNFISNTGGKGAYIVGAGTTNVHFTGGYASGNGASGIALQGISGCSIIGMTIGPAGGVGGNQSGIDFVGGNATANCVVSGNTITGNTDYQVGYFSTSATNIIRDNPGYNPVGASAAANMGASPVTITAGPTPETHYVRQSATNTATCTQGGRQIAALVSATTYYEINLGPNESYVCTWVTTAPTYTKVVH